MTAITFDTHQAPEMPFRVAEEPVPYNTRTRMETDNPYALMADLVGIGAGGPPDIAQNHKKIYREALSEKVR